MQLGKILILIAMLGVVNSVIPQSKILVNYSLDEGLPQASVLALMQDSKGNLWLGGQGGLSKFNGNTFVNYDTRHGMAGNHINELMEDKLYRIWVGHRYKGISVFVDDEFLKVPLTDTQINEIFQDKDGNIWIGTFGKGMFFLSDSSQIASENFVRVFNDFDKANLYVYDVFQLSNSRLLVGTSNGIYIIKGTPGNSMELINFNPDNSGFPIWNVMSIATNNQSNFWCSGYFGVSSFDFVHEDSLKNFKFFSHSADLELNFDHNILIDESNKLWGATDLGIFTFQNGVFDYSFSGTGYRNTRTNDILFDLEGNLWIGTMDNGLFKYTGDKFQTYNEAIGLVNDIVVSLTNDGKGTVCAATENGLCFIKDGEVKCFNESNGLISNSVDVVFYDSKGYLWIGYYVEGDLMRMDTKTGQLETFGVKDGLKNASAITIAEDLEGNIWFGSISKSVFKYSYTDNRRGVFSSYTTDDGLASTRIWKIHSDPIGNVWFGSDNSGLTKFDGNEFTIYKKEDGLTSLSPAALTSDKDNNLWIASIGGGIYKFDGKDFTNYSINQGLSSDSPFSIICDNNGIVWIGTNIGIDRFDPATGQFKHYGREEGFIGIENNQNSITKTPDGNIWFGTMNGVIRFDPEKDEKNIHIPRIAIEDINLFYNSFDYVEYSDSIDPVSHLPHNLRLNHKSNHLTFNYIGVTHVAPKKIKYQYMLDNFDETWNPVTQNTSATYTNLQPGYYTFKVKACNSDGLWTEQPATLSFELFPPFWQRTWFIIVAVFFISGLVYLLFWYRIKSMKRRNEKLEHLVNEKTKELKIEAEERRKAQLGAEQADKLKTAFLANMSHEIRTPVNAIVGFADLLKDPNLSMVEKEEYLEYITNGGRTLMNLINDIIDVSKIEAGQVRIAEESCNPDQLMSEIFIVFYEEMRRKGKKDVELIRVENEVNKNLQIVTDPLRLKQVMNNLLGNAIKFTDKGSIEFGYRLEGPDKVLFFVKDTGVGIPKDKQSIIFERFRQVDDAYTRNFDGTGLGLAISKKLVNLMRGELTVESTLGKGSEFIFSLPLVTNKNGKNINNVGELIKGELSLSGKKVLVVEDEDSNFLLIQTMLKQVGVEMLRAGDGETAISLYKNNKENLDAVLMDIKIPGINGYEATREIKKMNGNVPVIAQTAYAMSGEKEKCLDAGCDDYISKPYNRKELTAVLRKNIYLRK